MDYPPLLPPDHLVPLIQGLVPEELARVTILLGDLAYALTNDLAVANRVLNSVGSQIAECLDDEDTEEFRAILEKGVDSPDDPDA